MANEFMLSEFDLFQSSKMQHQIQDQDYVEYSPISPIQYGTPFRIVANGAPQQYWDLYNSYVVLRVKLVKAAGGAFAAAAGVAPINDIFDTLFSNIEVSLNDTVVSDNNGHYAECAYINKLLSYSDDVQKSRMRLEGFIKDTAGEFNARAVDGANAGYKDRLAMFAEGKEVELMGKLNCDLFNQTKAILPNCKLILNFIPHRSLYNIICLDGLAADEPRMVIIDCRFRLHVLYTLSAIAAAHEHTLMTMPARYWLNRMTAKHLTIPTGSTTVLQDNLYQGVLPKRLYFALVNDAAMTGTYATNPLEFLHFNCRYFGLYKNGKLVTGKALEPDFTKGAYGEAYRLLNHRLHYNFGNKSVNLTTDEFAKGYTIYVFDLTPHQLSSCESPEVSGSIRVEIKFSQATAATINLLCVAEFTGLLQIDFNRHVMIS